MTLKQVIIIICAICLPAVFVVAESYTSLRQKAICLTDETNFIEETRLAEEARLDKETKRQECIAQGYVDLGLPSGTLWKKENEGRKYYTYDEAISKFGDNLPTKEQFEELNSECEWIWVRKGYEIIGPNGNSIFLPAAGFRNCIGEVVHSTAAYWSCTLHDLDHVWSFVIVSLMRGSAEKNLNRSNDRCLGQSVRLVCL